MMQYRLLLFFIRITYDIFGCRYVFANKQFSNMFPTADNINFIAKAQTAILRKNIDTVKTVL